MAGMWMVRTGVAGIAVLIWIGSASADLEAAHTVVVKPEVHVKGPKLRVGDVAEVSGSGFEAVADVEIGYAALPGQSRTIQASLIQSQLERAGFSNHEVELAGAPAVRAVTRSVHLTRIVIEESLRQFIETEMPWDPVSTTIDLQVPSLEIVVPEGELEFAWRPSPDYRYLGHGSFRGEIRVDGVIHKTLICRASIQAYGPVVVAASSIPRGQTLTVNDIVIEQRALASVPRDVVRDPREILGLVAVKTIFPDQILTRRLLNPPILVRKNQVVTVETRTSGLVVRSRAKALGDGCEGSTVLCRNIDSGEQFMGEVRSDGVVWVQ